MEASPDAAASRRCPVVHWEASLGVLLPSGSKQLNVGPICTYLGPQSRYYYVAGICILGASGLGKDGGEAFCACACGWLEC